MAKRSCYAPSSSNEVRKLFINNAFVEAASGKTFPVINPATEEIICHVAEADAADVNRAVEAAEKALPAWKRLAPKERGLLLQKLANLIEHKFEDLARLEVLDNGKPIREARSCDIPDTIDCFRYFGGWTDKLTGELAQTEKCYHSYTVREPIGVLAAIVPWNYPLLMATWKLAPALACGNCIILKPAEQTPLSALVLGELFVQAGFPPGVVSILPGFGEKVGEAITHHPKIKKVSFTGSGEVGRIIMKASASTNLKRVTLELGGKSANIVFNDANIADAVEGAYLAIFQNTGQNCVAGSRLFLQEDIYDDFLAKLVDYTKKNARVGLADEDETTIGPLVDKDAFARVIGYIEKGKKEGARLALGGGRWGSKGYWVEPTIFADVTDEMTVAKEEIFGPVLAVLKFKSLEEVLQRSNALGYGLGAGVWTNDFSKAQHCVSTLESGSVWVNCYNYNPPNLPFGGFKESGFGRDLGPAALNDYTETKAVTFFIKPALASK